jgi:hypothetical protein
VTPGWRVVVISRRWKTVTPEQKIHRTVNIAAVFCHHRDLLGVWSGWPKVLAKLGIMREVGPF